MGERTEITGLDEFDWRIMEILAGQGRISIADLARRVGLSKSPVQARVKRLEQSGVIRGYRAMFDSVRLGLDHVAFVEVRLSDTREAALRAFNAAVAKIAEVEEAHMMAAGFDYLLKVRTRDMRAYRRVLGEEISGLPHVAGTSTYVAMQAVKEGVVGDVIEV
ncbi:Lrp/AsnC family transcriptional regulator [Rhodalgimonas zhirmunskyi]|uniref:Lrp/AsnC family transcriptional regulator n=1 Tax=Rhodalgimonas zhirmunskyi TaxID=2964767 RepID=A0AAJ1UEL2_9RHOB|nr:Lrp/AsnC family transcriptional regulator [Rhodoalgimonas zhirmunskyi]MDQ2094632.1 Lrp/AsnC family transcriptional regulator [Rhodoalgimonas zhirmunskyi]